MESGAGALHTFPENIIFQQENMYFLTGVYF